MICEALHGLQCSIPRHRLKRNYATFVSSCHSFLFIETRIRRPTACHPPQHIPPSPQHGFHSLGCRNGPTFPVPRRFSSQPQEVSSTKERDPIVTDEGIILHQADPSDNDGQGLVWGSVLWPSGVSLSKYLHYRYSSNAAATINYSPLRVLELGCGTGIVGLTLAKCLPTSQVSLTDSESALWPLLRKNIDCNVVPNTITSSVGGGSASSLSTTTDKEEKEQKRVVIHGLDWRDPSTFLPARNFDLIVAADVLYSGMDKLFARALASHLTCGDNEALVACPFRKDSPLEGFFGACHRLGLKVERLEDEEGRATGAHFGTNPFEAYATGVFVPLKESSNLVQVTVSPSFAEGNEQNVQIFRVYRSEGRPEDAIQIRRVSRI